MFEDDIRREWCIWGSRKNHQNEREKLTNFIQKFSAIFTIRKWHCIRI